MFNNDLHKNIDSFCEALGGRSESPLVSNPYLSRERRNNLKCSLLAMLERPGKRILVVGEALGYRGGRLTGIPFSSAALLRDAPHPLWRQLAPELSIEDDTAEATASIVWQYLARRRTLPLFWNAFPFHPHLSGDPASNRAPLRPEIAEGERYLREIAEFYQPDLVAGLGQKGSLAAASAFPERPVARIRHPSYGGKADFTAGMNQLLKRRIPASR